jgi:hypothetical protein
MLDELYGVGLPDLWWDELYEPLRECDSTGYFEFFDYGILRLDYFIYNNSVVHFDISLFTTDIVTEHGPTNLPSSERNGI